MRIRRSEMMTMVRRLVAEQAELALQEGISFVEGETLELHRPVRVIPLDNGGYFAGEVKGSRGRGTTAATLPAGTRCTVVKRLGNREAWVSAEGLDGYIRIDINKFSPEHAERYLQGSRKGPPVPPKAPGSPPGMPTNPAQLRASIGKLEAQLQAMRDQLEAMEEAEVTGEDPWDEKTPVDEPR